MEKLKLVDGLQTITLLKGEFVLKEGEDGDDFYIIESGQVACLKLVTSEIEGDGVMKLDTLGGKTGLVHVRTLGTGEHFGELALINNEKRSLSVRVKSDNCSLSVDRDAFTRILARNEDHKSQ